MNSGLGSKAVAFKLGDPMPKRVTKSFQWVAKGWVPPRVLNMPASTAAVGQTRKQQVHTELPPLAAELRASWLDAGWVAMQSQTPSYS